MVLNFREAQNSIEGVRDECLACSAGWIVPERCPGHAEWVRLLASESEEKRKCNRGKERGAPEF